MPKRCRLTARAQVDGEVRESGYVFMLADGDRGPHRAVGMNSPYPRDEPLFEEYPEEEASVEEPKGVADDGSATDPNAAPAAVVDGAAKPGAA